MSLRLPRTPKPPAVALDSRRAADRDADDAAGCANPARTPHLRAGWFAQATRLLIGWFRLFMPVPWLWGPASAPRCSGPTHLMSPTSATTGSVFVGDGRQHRSSTPTRHCSSGTATTPVSPSDAIRLWNRVRSTPSSSARRWLTTRQLNTFQCRQCPRRRVRSPYSPSISTPRRTM